MLGNHITLTVGWVFKPSAANGYYFFHYIQYLIGILR